jgi:hypothetical protein
MRPTTKVTYAGPRRSGRTTVVRARHSVAKAADRPYPARCRHPPRRVGHFRLGDPSRERGPRPKRGQEPRHPPAGEPGRPVLLSL